MGDEIDHESAVAHAAARGAVAAAAHRQHQAVVAREVDRGDHIGGAGTARQSAAGVRSIIPFQIRRALS